MGAISYIIDNRIQAECWGSKVFNSKGWHMGYKFWITRALKVFHIVFVLLFIVQLLKQHSIEDSVVFAIIWSCLATLVFIGSRVYQSRKGIECDLCNDMPDSEKNTRKSEKQE